ncbi:hypothetical protein OROGR_023675 [Orobanche gracilis]
MDPETALEFVKHGATIILLDVPQYTLIGVDTQMYSSGPNFKGIKMIPPGIHFVYYSSSNRKGSDIHTETKGKIKEFYHTATKADWLKLLCSENDSFEEHPSDNMLSFVARVGYIGISAVIVRKWDQEEERFVKLLDDEVATNNSEIDLRRSGKGLKFNIV